MKISPARTAAFDVLLGIEKERAFSSVLLPAFEEPLSPQDRGLCHQLVLGTLRNQIYLDRLIAVLSKGRRIDIEVRIALRLAIYQLKFLDRIPAHSAVNESVNLVHRAKKSSARPFVNAILRRLLRETVELVFTDILDRTSVETSHPRWLLEKWTTDLGVEEARSLAKANNEEPQAAFRLLSTDPRSREDVLKFAHESESVPGCYLANGNEQSLVQLANENAVYFQDEGSQMVARSVQVESGHRILDVCASPGGKTGLIAQKAREKGAIVFAGDITKRRVELLSENLSRQAIAVDGIIRFDAVDRLPFDGLSFDSVLVDAPCSGTGTIRHNPELRYLIAPEDFDRFAGKQLSILISASELVRPGGQLIYSTCSLEREENEAVCERFLADVDGFLIAEPLVPRRFITTERFGRTRPDRDGMDGFFIAAFCRK